MPFSNRLAMGSMLNLSLHTQDGSKQPGSPSLSKMFKREGKKDKKEEKKEKVMQSQPSSSKPPSPALFGHSRQREKRVQSANNTPTVAPSASPVHSSPRSEHIHTPNTRSPPTPRARVAVAPTPSPRPTVPAAKKSMFNLKNLSTSVLGHFDHKSAPAPAKREPSKLAGLGVPGLFGEELSSNARIVKAEDVVSAPQQVPAFRFQPQPVYSIPLEQKLDRIDSISSMASSSLSEDDFASYSQSLHEDFPMPPSEVPKVAVTAEPSTATPASAATPETPQTLKDLQALKAATAQMYTQAYSPVASPAFVPSPQKVARKAAPQWKAPGLAELPEPRISFRPASVILDDEVDPMSMARVPAAKPFYSNLRATQSVMVFSSARKPVPGSPEIPGRRESLTPTLASYNFAIPARRLERPDSDISHHGSYSSASSSNGDSDCVPSLTSSGASTKTESSGSESGSVPSTPSEYPATFAVHGFAPRAPNAPYLKKPNFLLEVAAVDDSEGYMTARSSPVIVHDIVEKKAHKGISSWARGLRSKNRF